jgi:hypothetical protein
MRVSVGHGDMGAKVFLNGKRLQYCISADDEKGEALVYKRKDDDYIINFERDGCETEILTGKIRIEKKQ